MNYESAVDFKICRESRELIGEQKSDPVVAFVARMEPVYGYIAYIAVVCPVKRVDSTKGEKVDYGNTPHFSGLVQG